MQADRVSDLEPAPARRAPDAVAAAHLALLPFLSELSAADARFRDARQRLTAAEQRREAADRSDGLAAATDSMRREAADGRAAATDARAQRRDQTLESWRAARAQATDRPAPGAPPASAPPDAEPASAPRTSAATDEGAQRSASRAASPARAAPPAAEPHPTPASTFAQVPPADERSATSGAAPLATAPRSAAPGTAATFPAVPPSGGAVTRDASAAAAADARVGARAVQSSAAGNGAAGGELRSSAPGVPGGQFAGSAERAGRGGRAAPPPASRPAEADETGSDGANVRQILRVLRSQIGKERAHVSMRLDPPSLGTLRIRLDLREQGILLRFEPQTELAQRLLTGNADALREALESSGLHVERLEIRPPVDDSPLAHRPPADDGRPPQDRTGQHANPQGRDEGPSGGRSGGDFDGPQPAASDAARVERIGMTTESSLNVLA